jgi:metal-responsive CopG/Arc/MetJ family transcriptional regulator
MINKFLISNSERRNKFMKQKLFTRPISVVLSVDMFDQIKTITDQGNIGFSDFIRDAIKRKLDECQNNKQNKEENKNAY